MTTGRPPAAVPHRLATCATRRQTLTSQVAALTRERDEARRNLNWREGFKRWQSSRPSALGWLSVVLSGLKQEGIVLSRIGFVPNLAVS